MPRPGMGVDAPVDPRSILSIDPSITTTGWARWWHPENGPPQRASGYLALKDLGNTPAQRIDLYLRWLTREIETMAPDLIVIEEPFAGRAGDNAGTQHALGTLYMMTFVVGLRRVIHVRPLSRSEVTKSVMGWSLRPVDPNWTPQRGRRPKMRGPRKDEIAAAISARHGMQVTCNDEADAIAGLDLVLAERAGTGMRIFSPSSEAAKVNTPGGAMPLDSMRRGTKSAIERKLAEMGVGTPPPKRPRRRAIGRARPKSG